MQERSQFALLRQRRFAPFYWTQFLGALNDNYLKNMLVVLFSSQILLWHAIDSNVLINGCSFLFIAPFFLFSALAGQLADKYDKARLIRYCKLLEIGIMGFAAVGLTLHHVPLLLLALFLLGVQAAAFGPLKYSILPQHLRPEELLGGNALVEMGTFVAIMLGTVCGGIVIYFPDLSWAAALGLLIAIAGYGASCAIPRAAAVAPVQINWNIVTTTWQNICFARQSKVVFRALLGIAWFWFYGAFLLAQLPGYVSSTLHGNTQVLTLFCLVLSFGIGLGALLCERLSGHFIEIGLVPLGSIGLSVFVIYLACITPSLATTTLHPITALSRADWQALFACFALSVFAGIYSVPLYTLIQLRSEPDKLSRIVSANNILNAVFMLLSALCAIVLLQLGWHSRHLLLFLGVCNALVAVYIYAQVPEFFMRFLIWFSISTLYRVRTQGLEHIPDKGSAILICNHISFIDALVIAAYCRRPIRFVVDHRIFRIPVLHFIFRTAKAIPVASAKEDPALKERAFAAVAAALQSGELVGLFPEGGITRDGELQRFRRGIEGIVAQTPVPVIPIALRGLWGSFFSRRYGKAMRRFPRQLWYRIGLVVGEPVPPAAVNTDDLYQRVLALRGDEK